MSSPIIFTLNEHFLLEVFAFHNSEYRITVRSGLTLLGLPLDWILHLSCCPKKLNKLKNRGFSGNTKQCQIITFKGIETVDTLSLQDWLIIWEFFACRGSSKAAAILRACAEENIPNRIQKMQVA